MAFALSAPPTDGASSRASVGPRRDRRRRFGRGGGSPERTPKNETLVALVVLGSWLDSGLAALSRSQASRRLR